MPNFDYTASLEERETVTFGTADKKVIIDCSFIPSSLGYAIKQMMSARDEQGISKPCSPEFLAGIIALFTDEVSVEWMVEHLDYGTLDQIAARIIRRALTRRAEKKED